MDFLSFFAATLLSGGLFLAASVYVLKAALSQVLAKQLEQFKQQLQVDSKMRELTLKSEIEFRERQLGEYYGPIYALLRRGEPIYRLWEKDRLVDIDFAVNKLLIDGNNAIVEIILKKSHLVAGPKIPESFIRFLTHVAVWHSYMETEHKGVPLSKSDFPEAYYPTEFEDEIVATTERLKTELFDLHSRFGLLGRNAT